MESVHQHLQNIVPHSFGLSPKPSSPRIQLGLSPSSRTEPLAERAELVCRLRSVLRDMTCQTWPDWYEYAALSEKSCVTTSAEMVGVMSLTVSESRALSIEARLLDTIAQQVDEQFRATCLATLPNMLAVLFALERSRLAGYGGVMLRYEDLQKAGLCEYRSRKTLARVVQRLTQLGLVECRRTKVQTGLTLRQQGVPPVRRDRNFLALAPCLALEESPGDARQAWEYKEARRRRQKRTYYGAGKGKATSISRSEDPVPRPVRTNAECILGSNARDLEVWLVDPCLVYEASDRWIETTGNFQNLSEDMVSTQKLPLFESTYLN